MVLSNMLDIYESIEKRNVFNKKDHYFYIDTYSMESKG